MATEADAKQLEEQRERNRKPRFWWHGQNLKEDSPKAWLHGRGWLHDRRSRFVLGISWLFPSHFTHAYIEMGDIEHQITVALACPLFALWAHVEGVQWLRRWYLSSGLYGYERKIGVSVHNWSLWWELWANPYGGNRRLPKWRDGSFDIPRFFLGKNKYTKVDGAPTPATVSMPEGEYAVTVTFFEQTWKRPRWPWPRQSKGADVDIEGGIPVPGKGENSWDCDEDAFLSIGTSAQNVEEALADVTRRVLERRERYGGANWLPEKARST